MDKKELPTEQLEELQQHKWVFSCQYQYRNRIFLVYHCEYHGQISKMDASKIEENNPMQ